MAQGAATAARVREPHELIAGGTQPSAEQLEVADSVEALSARIAEVDALLAKTAPFLPQPATGVPAGSRLRDRVLESLAVSAAAFSPAAASEEVIR